MKTLKSLPKKDREILRKALRDAGEAHALWMDEPIDSPHSDRLKEERYKLWEEYKILRNRLLNPGSNTPDLESLLEQVTVQKVGPQAQDPDFGVSLGSWLSVCTDKEVIAYFADETDALRFRLDYINGILNPVTQWNK